MTATDYENIRANYEEFALPSSKSDVNVIEIESNSLSIENLKEAITQAAATAEDDLIVLRTTVGNNILLFSSVDDAMTISIDSSAYGSLTIVAYGTNPLTIDAAGYSTLLTVDEGQVNFGNLTRGAVRQVPIKAWSIAAAVSAMLRGFFNSGGHGDRQLGHR